MYIQLVFLSAQLRFLPVLVVLLCVASSRTFVARIVARCVSYMSRHFRRSQKKSRTSNLRSYAVVKQGKCTLRTTRSQLFFLAVSYLLPLCSPFQVVAIIVVRFVVFISSPPRNIHVSDKWGAVFGYVFEKSVTSESRDAV